MMVERAVAVPMRDGTVLRADVYRPDPVGTYPVLLMRLPYGRAIASTVTYRHPAWYARRGYIVVIQDVRGCGASAGTFYPFRHEEADGYDTVRWCAQDLPGSNGTVGMYGFSYQGVTQWQAAIAQPPGLVTICPAMASADLTEGWLHWGGAFCWEFGLTWALQLTQNQAQFHRLEPLATQLAEAQREVARWLAFRPQAQMPPLRGVPQGAFFLDWLANPPDSAYWRALSPLTHFDRFDLPALHIAGWADPFVAGTMATYERARAVTRQPQHLIAGPWAHMPWQRWVGELDCGPAAVSQVDAWQVAWFDRWLKGEDTGVVPLTRWFVLGPNVWQEGDRPWLETPGQTWYLDGETLSANPPPHPEPRTYVSDPRNPVRSTPYGPYSQRAVETRWDVLRYTSAPLAQSYRLQGRPQLAFQAETDAVQTDWVVKLMVGFPDGGELLVSMGVWRGAVSPGIQTYTVTLRPTAWEIPAGSSWIVAIASGAFPAIGANPHCGIAVHQARVADGIEATHTVYGGELHLPRGTT